MGAGEARALGDALKWSSVLQPPPVGRGVAAVGDERLGCVTRDLAAGEHVGHAEEDVEREMRSEEHTSELQSLMRISYAVFCLKKKKKINSTLADGHNRE